MVWLGRGGSMKALTKIKEQGYVCVLRIVSDYQKERNKQINEHIIEN